MSIEYRYLDKAEQHDVVAMHLLMREAEHHQYDLERKYYEGILADLAVKNLPAEWPDGLRQYQARNRDQLAQFLVQGVLTQENYDLVANLQFRDDMRKNLTTVLWEITRVEAYYKHLQPHLPADVHDAAIARAQAKRAKALGRIADGGK